MIGKLKGRIEVVTDNQAIVDVSGVGYLVFCSRKTLDCFELGRSENSEYAELLIETHVREDHIHLYGFANIEEKQAFNILQSVKGVGTKMALTILSTLAPNEIQAALTNQDPVIFQQVSGIGKKLAERIITELKDKLISSDAGFIKMQNSSKQINNDKASDAVIALVNLGINKNEAQIRISNILKTEPNLTISELIKLGLNN